MIIADLDGVFADFVNAACRVHGRPDYVVQRWNFFEDWGISTDEFWRVIHDRGDLFYSQDVHPYPWAEELWSFINSLGEEVVVMSSPSDNPVGYAGKKIWVDKYLGTCPLIVGSQKQLLATPERLLLDDCDDNIDKFVAHGGHTITFPQPWNLARSNVPIRLSSTVRLLKSWAGKHD